MGLTAVALRTQGYLESWELAAYDWSVRAAPKQRGAASVVVIAVSESDILALGHWPLSDAILAMALKKLLASGPRAIGVDIYRDLPVEPGSRELTEVLTSNPTVIMVMKFGGGGQARVQPPAVLRGLDQVGFNDILVDRDGVVRRALLFLDDGLTAVYSFALRLALLSLQRDGIFPQPDPAVPKYFRLGDNTFRPLEATDGSYAHIDSRGYQFLLDYKRAANDFPTYSFTSLLDGHIPREVLTDKIVVIGVSAESVPDLVHTPLGSGIAGDRGGTYGVRIHTFAIDQLLRNGLGEAQPIHAWTDGQETLWILLWAGAGGMIGILATSAWRFFLISVGGIIFLGVLVQLLFVRGVWIPFGPAALVWLSSAALMMAYTSNEERQQRALLMQLFSRHVSPEVADTIWREREEFFDGGRPRSQKLIATVLFADLEGFTSVSERMDPQTLLNWLNAYIEVMVQQVIQHHGVVDDYYGDAIKANFGIPLARQAEAEIRQDAMRAVDCALDMEKAMNELWRMWQHQELPRVRLRIGIFTGPVVAGSLGSAQRLKYTTVGDAVNIAARLESYDKDLREATFGNSTCRILIGGPTLDYLDGRHRVIPVGFLSLKGKDTKIAVYRVVGGHESVADAQEGRGTAT